MRAAAALILLLLAVSACSGDTEEPATTAAAPPPPAEGTTETTAEEPAAEPRRLRLAEFATGLESPVHVTGAPGDPGRLYVTEQEGRIRVVEEGRLDPQPFLDISGDVTAGGEQGLLSTAFHPAYEENGRFYVNYTNVDGDTRVVEFRASGGRADPDTAREVLAIDQPYSNHNGGQVAFGPDGLLYVGMGDGGSGGDPENRAQNLGDLLGKLLRIDVDDEGARPEIVAYGLRNPWRFSFDRETGDVWIGDVGQGAREEIDFARWPLDGLVNFGWDVFEGDLQHEEKEPNGEGRLVGPVATYGREDGYSVTGGFVYRGDAMPGLRGRYFYGDYGSGYVWSLRLRNGKAVGVRREPFDVDELSSFGEDLDGELYLVSLGGTIYRLAS